MNLHEYQAKQLFSEYGLPVPEGFACDTPQEAFEAAGRITTEKKVVIVEHKLGFININAGIDQSNIPQDKNLALLLPENPTKSAVDLHQELTKFLNKNISIIISDSMTRPFRSGVTNFALASHNIQRIIE